MNNDNLIQELEIQLKNFLDDYEESLKHSAGKSKEELDTISTLEKRSRIISLQIEI